MKFVGITTFYNPSSYVTKKQNFDKFRTASKKQGLYLIAIELAFDDKPFELADIDADKVVRVRGGEKNKLWQKERLLNLALAHLPDDCQYVAWLDCDVLFFNDNWISDAIIELQNYQVAQLFTTAYRAIKGQTSITAEELVQISYGKCNGMRVPACAVCPDVNLNPSYGFAWAARREFIEKVKFFDLGVVGGGDYLMANGFRSNIPERHWKKSSTEAMLVEWSKWAKMAFELSGGRIGVIEGHVLHLWHGDIGRREYSNRNNIIMSIGYMPDRDLKINSDGLWEWVGWESVLKEIEQYFNRRQEDEEERTRYLVHKGSGGIADRLNSMAYAILYSQLYNRKLIVDWRDNMYSDYNENSFYRLFVCPRAVNELIPLGHPTVPKLWMGKENLSVYRFTFSDHDKNVNGSMTRKHLVESLAIHTDKDYPEKVAYLWGRSRFHLCLIPGAELLGYGDTDDQVFRNIIERELQPIPHILREVEVYKKQFFAPPIIGVHIRDSDRSLGKYEPYFEKIDAEPSATRIFLCTDSAEAYDAMVKKYGGRVFYRYKNFPNDKNTPMHYQNQGYLSGVEALIDLWLLRSCETIIYWSGTGFGRMAALLSDGKKVDVK